MEQNSLTSSRPYRVLTGVVCGYFMVQLTLVPVSAMLPTLAREFSVSVSYIGWIMTIYLLALTCFQLFAGRLGDQLLHQRVFQVGVVIFGASSLLAALCVTYWQLVLCRGFQGIGAALLSGNSLAIVHKVFPPHARGKAISLLTSAAALGSILGIVIGGLFIQFLNWRFVFLLCVPVAILSFALLYSNEKRNVTFKWREIDLPGGGLFCTFLVLFFLAFGGKGHDHSDSTSSISSFIHWDHFVLALFVLYVFVQIEKKASNPIIYFDQLKNKFFTFSVLSNFLLHFVMMCVVFFVPFVVEKGLGKLPIFTSMVLLTVEIMNAIFPHIGGYLYHRKKWTWIRPGSMIIIATGLCVYYFQVNHAEVLTLCALGAWIGVGMGVYWSINNHVMMTTLDDHYRGFASGMVETTRQMGHTLSTGISAVAMGIALETNIQTGGTEMLFEGTQSILMIAVAGACIGFLFSIVKKKDPVEQKPHSLSEGR